MLKKFLISMSIMFDILKSFLIAVIVICAILIAFVSVIHNVLKIREAYDETVTEYENLVWVKENRMNVQVTGTGEKTIVILSDFAMPSPIIQYKTYTEALSNNYRVVLIEYFGYGYSLSADKDRTAPIIISEIKEALEQVGVTGQYTIMANGISSIYAELYTFVYAGELERLILVDGIYPETIEENYLKNEIQNLETNAVLTFLAELTGFARVLSYISPETFGIDKMQEYGFSETDIKIYRKMIANRFYTASMRKEIQTLEKNMEMLKNYVLPDYLPVTQILSSEYVKEYEEYKNKKYIDKDLLEYANSIITNSEIQKVVMVEGNKNLNLYNPSAVVAEILSE